MRLSCDGVAAAADEKIEIGAAVRLLTCSMYRLA